MPTTNTAPICLLTGAGPGTGAAIARRFAAGGYRVALLARNAARLSALAAGIDGASAYVCDVAEPEQVAATVAAVRADLGDPDVLIHNATLGAFGDFLTVDPDIFERNFRVNTTALLRLAQAVAPAMIERGEGAILCTGNTAAYRGVPYFAGFAPTKAAQRILAESLARSLGSKGIHVAYVAIDAVIDLPWTRKRNPDAPDEFFCKPDDIAGEVWHIAHQPRSAWTFDAMIRPFGEKW